MKKLLLTIVILLSLQAFGGSVYEPKEVDPACLANCMSDGYEYWLCKQICGG